MDDRTHLLISLFVAIEGKTQDIVYDDAEAVVIYTAVDLDDIKQAFKTCGCDIDKLREEGKISGY